MESVVPVLGWTNIKGIRTLSFYEMPLTVSHLFLQKAAVFD